MGAILILIVILAVIVSRRRKKKRQQLMGDDAEGTVPDDFYQLNGTKGMPWLYKKPPQRKKSSVPKMRCKKLDKARVEQASKEEALREEIQDFHHKIQKLQPSLLELG